ncbi:Type III restriction enzyme, res subunit family protein [Trichomonas vaginalis G3]|uniref:Type III restriction enzyme, res subunit family protein n=1 Tax=Trichomonas vaginalis (strain ATCC PRA-98 / G3) TaxID=412133 RepID=A2DYR1_TRIV3|nr:Fanconi anemia group M (FancM) family member family [Trichomonas vaginalis G3]EAY14451.1 Type III restriction enzyme, res subunit family protein [Trichomonas vaginalis G3]KAI5499937.1 Fanconi anemia group M (FancM) family member family [Trichomonas vaginalis G3]|eukprot:XP_001326674.1 Type III restriction enzyme, res subunit family protein [Trichomonas vaginalis G3]
MQKKSSLGITSFLEGTDETASALNFPPTEILRKPDDKYVEADKDKLMTFLYPCDVPRRNYQYDISQACFKENTLVCLPTGTGKTFIASVVMMNFYRWYPSSLIIFCATTRALVEQQISACNSFTTIPEDDTVVLVGTSSTTLRKIVWDDYRVVYATPQTVQNEIKKGKLDPCKISLIIFDEAHHAHGKQSYGMITRMVAERSSQFRVIGLSATPGSNIQQIQDIIYNLMISQIIYKDDTDPDIAQYQHQTDIEYITVHAGDDDEAVRHNLDECIQFIASPLQNSNVLSIMNLDYLTRGSVFLSMNKYKETSQGAPNFSKNMSYLTILLSLTAMKEKLLKYGPNFLDKAIKDFENKRNSNERRQLMATPAYIALAKSTNLAKSSSHPKLAKLHSILSDFFSTKKDSRCIVFASLREVAADIEKNIKNVPNVNCHVFTGKAATDDTEGMTDHMQQTIVDLFRKGTFNVIIATCVAEEGLDIGEVDLIVCYDVQASALRTFQRIGRTGRKRAGRVVFLISEGVEERALKKALNTKTQVKDLLTKSISRFVLYKPLVPNLPLPKEMQAIKLMCAKEKGIAKYFAPNQQRKSHKPILGSTEALEFKTVFNKSFKFRKPKFDIKMASFGIRSKCKTFSHSSETIILNTFAYNFSESQPESLDQKVENLFGQKSDSENDSDIAEKSVFSVQTIAKSSETSDSESNSTSELEDDNSQSFSKFGISNSVPLVHQQTFSDFSSQNSTATSNNNTSTLYADSSNPYTFRNSGFGDSEPQDNKFLSSDDDEQQNSEIQQQSFLSDSSEEINIDQKYLSDDDDDEDIESIIKEAEKEYNAQTQNMKQEIPSLIDSNSDSDSSDVVIVGEKHHGEETTYLSSSND